MPTFNNKSNKFHKDKNGNPFWESRSVAVEVAVFALHKNIVYVLIEKRSATMMDSPGSYCMPSGYIDYDENGWDAARREVYEETSLDLDKYDKICITNNKKKPFDVITDPNINRQNVVLEYCIVLNFNKYPFPSEITRYRNKEIAEIIWLPIDMISNPYFEWAFNHDDRIKNAYNAFKKYIRPNFWRRLMNFFH